nr:hypothetical protein [uncultured Flavobacterium sp.]
MAKKKKTLKQILHKGIKAKLREDQLKDNYFQRTKQQTHKDKKTYTRKNQKPPENNDE